MVLSFAFFFGRKKFCTDKDTLFPKNAIGVFEIEAIFESTFTSGDDGCEIKLITVLFSPLVVCCYLVVYCHSFLISKKKPTNLLIFAVLGIDPDLPIPFSRRLP